MAEDIKPQDNQPDEIAKLQSEAAQNLLGWQRALADYQNLQKEWAGKLTSIKLETRLEMLREILPTLDILDRVASEAPGDGSPWLDGLRHLNTQLRSIINSWGVKRLETIGVAFDPHMHEAVKMDGEGGTIAEEISPGYTLEGRLIYPAKVVVGSNLVNNANE
jgi:molecular chaperone GrpE